MRTSNSMKSFSKKANLTKEERDFETKNKSKESPKNLMNDYSTEFINN